MRHGFAAVLAFVMLWVIGVGTASAATVDGNDPPESYPYGWVEDEVAVKFRQPSVRDVEARAAFETRHAVGFRSLAPGINWYRFRINDGANLDAKLATVRADPSVEQAIKSTIGRPAMTPDDPRYGDQWGLPKVKMPAAWDVAGGGPTKYIAIVDSGVANGRGTDRHPDLGRIWGWNFWGGNGDNADNCDHGTKMAGVAAAFTNNDVGIAGINYAAPILGVKILEDCIDYSSNIAAEGIRYAVDNGASVITASWGFPGSDAQNAMLKDAVQYAWNNDVLVVAASGNSDWNGFDTLIPARWSKVVTVGATFPSDNRWRELDYVYGERVWSGSNYGTPGLDLSAPGSDILSTAMGFQRSYTYEYGTGTSIAVPFVAGTIALMRKMDMGLSSTQLKTILNNAADKVGGYSYSNSFSVCSTHSWELGCGRLDASEAVRDARDYR